MQHNTALRHQLPIIVRELLSGYNATALGQAGTYVGKIIWNRCTTSACQDLLSPDALEEVRHRFVKLAKAEKPAVDTGRAIENAETEVANLGRRHRQLSPPVVPGLRQTSADRRGELERLKAADTHPATD